LTTAASDDGRLAKDPQTLEFTCTYLPGAGISCGEPARSVGVEQVGVLLEQVAAAHQRLGGGGYLVLVVGPVSAEVGAGWASIVPASLSRRVNR
jgi:hypothetical protein